MQIELNVFMLYILVCIYLHILTLIVNVAVEEELSKDGICFKYGFSLHPSGKCKTEVDYQTVKNAPAF